MAIFIRLYPPYSWVKLQENKVAEFGEVPSLTDYPIQLDDEVIVVVNDALVGCHQVSSPAKSHKQFLQALPFAIEDFITQDVSELQLIDYEWQPEKPSTVFTIEKQKLNDLIEICQTNKLFVSKIIPEFALLPLHNACDHSLASYSNHQVLSRSQSGQGSIFSKSFLTFWLQGLQNNASVAVNDMALAESLKQEFPKLNFRHWDFGNKSHHWLEHHDGDLTHLDRYNLLRGEFAKILSVKKQTVWKWPNKLLAGAFLAYLISNTLFFLGMQYKQKRVEQEFSQLLKKELPQMPTMELNGVRQVLESRLSDMSKNTKEQGFLYMISEVANTFTANNAVLESISYRNKQLSFTCKLSDLTQVDTLLNTLNQGAYKASLESSNVVSGAIVARYRLNQR